MDGRIDLFSKFGGLRPMARKLSKPVGTVNSWKRARRVSAAEQPFVLRRATELGLDVTAEDVMFPFPEDRPLL